MPVIRVFEPPLCCNTGVCGPELDQNLVTFTADLNHLATSGADISRFNLASDPAAFAANPGVLAFLKTAGSENLPLVLVDDVTVLTGRYPTRAELTRYAGMTIEVLEPAAAPRAKGCCGGASDGCGGQ
ncbi:MAG: arsenite efflux transporter metallochaperone ArsD [Propionibacteriaceae bacterium]|nr:arsenite efflux transporter metallochaperone ArsD [Propionibacteriaceae bacterium]